MNPLPGVLGEEPRLFVDLRDVEFRENVVHTYHSAERYGRQPVLRQEAPWERSPGMTASVVRDPVDGRFKAWYMAGHYAEGVGHVQCLTTSPDGIHWERPCLGLHPALGSTQNNIVIPADYHEGMDHWESMLIDPLGTGPRFKALGWSSFDWDGPLSGIYTAVSADGLRWSHTPEPVFHYHPRPGTADLGPVGDAQALMIDTRRRRYVAFLRGTDTSRKMSVSEDFVHWTPPVPFLYPLHDDETLYNNVGFVYGDQYLGFLTHFDRSAYHQTQTLQLLTSRDGDRWLRAPAAAPLIGLGELGSWDRFQLLLTGAPPIRVGDRLFIYYRGTNRRHAKIRREFEPRLSQDQDPRTMAIGLATLRVDGFASVGGSFDGAQLVTKTLKLDGDLLMLNLQADHGQTRVELLDEQGEPLPGWTRGECVPLEIDSVAGPVIWQGRHSLRELQGRPVKLRFLLTNARLYSYWTRGTGEKSTPK